MKKTLMVLGLVLMASVAMAQTFAPAGKAMQMQRVSKAQQMEAVTSPSYKASIFTKQIDTLLHFHFGAADTAGIQFGRSAVISRGMTINGTSSNSHNAVSNKAVWNYIPDAYTYDWQTNYPRVYAYNLTGTIRTYMNDTNMYILRDSIGPEPTAAWKGCMCIAPIEMENENGNYINAYFTLPVVHPTTTYGMIDVTFFQIHCKFYDNTYIDYQLNGQWYSREINVDGVDAEINAYSSVHPRYTMPLALAGQDSIVLRFRMFAELCLCVDGGRGGGSRYDWRRYASLDSPLRVLSCR